MANSYSGWGVRHIQTLLIFLCFTVAYFIRSSMSVAIIAMTDSSAKDDILIFEWNKQIQDYLLSSFYLGYMAMQIPGGQLAFRYGGKRLIAMALIMNGAISFLLPTAASIGGWKAACCCRVTQGLFQGCIVPSMHTLIGKWAPLEERNRIGNFVYSGYHFGIIAAMLVSGKLAATRFGWPIIFYAGGALSLTFGCLWMYFGADSPSSHKTITEEEKSYIEKSLEQIGKKKPVKTPWRAMFTSVPLAALLAAHVGAVWGSMLMVTETPSFMKMALGINVENSGLLTALPYTCALLCTITASSLADIAINRNICSIITIRKTANTIGTWGSAAGMIALTFIPPGQTALGVFLIILIVALDSMNSMGFMLNHIDLSPNFAGMLVSFTNCVAAGFANLAPITAGIILKESTDITQWRIVFFIAAGVYFVSNLVFLLLGSGNRQYWDSDGNDDKEINLELTEEPLMKQSKENA